MSLKFKINGNEIEISEKEMNEIIEKAINGTLQNLSKKENAKKKVEELSRKESILLAKSTAKEYASSAFGIYNPDGYFAALYKIDKIYCFKVLLKICSKLERLPKDAKMGALVFFKSPYEVQVKDTVFTESRNNKTCAAFKTKDTAMFAVQVVKSWMEDLANYEQEDSKCNCGDCK